MKAAWLAALLVLPVMAQSGAERSSITFLLGEDEDPRLPMFQLAKTHFTRDPVEGTRYLVEEIRSLQGVRDYLDQHPPADGRPWGLINLVAHGCAGYLDVALVPGGPKLTTTNLRAFLKQRPFPVLGVERVDEQTEIRLHGCAVGEEESLLQALSRALGGDTAHRPLVRATRWFTTFRPADPAHGLPSRYLCRAWQVVFRPGSCPERAEVVYRFRATYPGTQVDVGDALTRTSARFCGDVFSYETPLRFTWTLAFPGLEEPPALPGPASKRIWLRSQASFQASLQHAGLAFDDLAWEVRPTRVRVQDREVPALAVLGEGRALHILQGLHSEGIPPQSAWEDARYYTSGR